jgi:5-formyltetrahydrofolate cyclo-ligase
MALNKLERRKYYRALQASFSSEQYENWNHALAPNLRETIVSISPGSFVAVYQARKKEADLSSLFDLPYKFCFPKVLSKEGEMEFRHVEALGKGFEPGAFGILEPKKSNPIIEKKNIAACFVPLLAFDSEGQRLGHGKGFYDRFLSGFTGMRIGAAFEWQFSPQALPVESHDMRLQIAITEHRIRKFS